jgi:DNA-binding beta-propeller fold protein YncE
MKKYYAVLWILCVYLIPRAQCQSSAPLKQIQSIPLPNVEGYFDHMAVDIKGQRLFVPGEHQRTIEVIDLRAGKVIHTITGFGGDPRKTIYLPETNEIWVDDGDATCKAFSGDTYELVKNIPLTGHELDKDSRRVPDNGVYDPATHLFYLGDRADGLKKEGVKGSIEIVDLKNGKLVGSIDVNGLNPAGLVLDPASPRMFVVMGDTSQVVVIDREKRAVILNSEGARDAAMGRPVRYDPGFLADPRAVRGGAVLPDGGDGDLGVQGVTDLRVVDGGTHCYWQHSAADPAVQPRPLRRGSPCRVPQSLRLRRLSLW